MIFHAHNFKKVNINWAGKSEKDFSKSSESKKFRVKILITLLSAWNKLYTNKNLISKLLSQIPQKRSATNVTSRFLRNQQKNIPKMPQSGKELVHLARSILPETDRSGWMAMLAGFFSFMFSYGFMRTWPLFFGEITEYLHNNHTDLYQPLYNKTHIDVMETHTSVTRTSSILMFTFCGGALISGMVLPLFGNRAAITLCGLISGLILVATSYFLEQGQLIMIMVLFMGLGSIFGLLNISAQNQVTKTVSPKGRQFAFCMISLGASTAYFTLPQLYRYILAEYGVLTSIKLTASLYTLVVTVGLFTKKTERLPLERPQLWSVSLWKNTPRLRWFMALGCLVWPAFWSSSTIVVDFYKHKFDIGLDVTSVLISMMGLGEVIGRVCALFGATKFRCEYVLYFCFGGEAICWILMCNTSSIPVGKFVAFSIGIVRGAFPGAFLALQSNSAPTSQHAVAAAMVYVTTGVLNATGVVAFYQIFKYNSVLPMYITAGMQLATFVPIYKLSVLNDLHKIEEQNQNRNVLESKEFLEREDEVEGLATAKMEIQKTDSELESVIRIDCHTSSSSDE